MKILFNRNSIKQVVCWILLLQIINVSINTPDLKCAKQSSLSKTENLSINETESVYELIAEGMFDKKVPDSDEDDMDTSSPSFELYFFPKICSKLPAFNFLIEYFPHYSNNFLSVHQEPHFPPPRFA